MFATGVLKNDDSGQSDSQAQVQATVEDLERDETWVGKVLTSEGTLNTCNNRR